MLKMSEVAEKLKVSVKTVRRLIDNNELKAHRVGRGIRVDEADLDAYIKKNTIKD